MESELKLCFARHMLILTGRSRSLLEKLSVDDTDTSTNLKWDKRSPWVEYSKPHPEFSSCIQVTDSSPTDCSFPRHLLRRHPVPSI